MTRGTGETARDVGFEGAHCPQAAACGRECERHIPEPPRKRDPKGGRMRVEPHPAPNSGIISLGEFFASVTHNFPHVKGIGRPAS